jgi:hypothetical protein
MTALRPLHRRALTSCAAVPQETPLRAPLPRTVSWTASSLLVPDLPGELKLNTCTFTANGGALAAPLPYASPPVAVLCSSDCKVSIADTQFLGNNGSLSSGLLLQSQANAQISLRNATLEDNVATWLAPRSAVLGALRWPVPAAAFLHIAFSAQPATAGLTAVNVRLARNAGSHGLVVMRPVDLNDAASEYTLSLHNASFVGHVTGPSALLAFGIRTASLTGLNLTGNTGAMLAGTARLLSAGSVACIALDSTAPAASAAMADVMLVNNSAVNAGALYVTTSSRAALFDLSPAGSLTLTGLLARGQRTTQWGTAVQVGGRAVAVARMTLEDVVTAAYLAQVSAVAQVVVAGGEVSENLGGGGMTFEFASSLELSGLAFSG